MVGRGHEVLNESDRPCARSIDFVEFWNVPEHNPSAQSANHYDLPIWRKIEALAQRCQSLGRNVDSLAHLRKQLFGHLELRHSTLPSFACLCWGAAHKAISNKNNYIPNFTCQYMCATIRIHEKAKPKPTSKPFRKGPFPYADQ